MARTKLTNKLNKADPANPTKPVPKMAARKLEPNKRGIKLPPLWHKLASRVGAFKRESIRMRLGKLDRYKTAILRMRNISRRKRNAKKNLIGTQPTSEGIQKSFEAIDKLCLIF
jgi:hypothetical protein